MTNHVFWGTFLESHEKISFTYCSSSPQTQTCASIQIWIWNVIVWECKIIITPSAVKTMLHAPMPGVCWCWGWGETCSVQLATICGQSGGCQSEGSVALPMTNEKSISCHVTTLSQLEVREIHHRSQSLSGFVNVNMLKVSQNFLGRIIVCLKTLKCYSHSLLQNLEVFTFRTW